MKSLVVYSSLTGNTKKIAEAVCHVMPDCRIVPVEDAPTDLESYGLIAVGWWASKGAPDAKTREWLKGVKNCRLVFFGTLGAKPDSDHAKDCMAQAERSALEPARGNIVCGSWMCQGKIDPKIIEVMRKLDLEVHRELLHDPSRLEEAASHPDDCDCRKAQAFMQGLLAGLEHSPCPQSRA